MSVEPFDKLVEVEGNYAYNAVDDDGVGRHYSDILAPCYYVFAGTKDADGAADLVGQLGLAKSIETYMGAVTVVNPSKGKSYTDADAEAFVELAASAGPANNVRSSVSKRVPTLFLAFWHPSSILSLVA